MPKGRFSARIGSGGRFAKRYAAGKLKCLKAGFQHVSAQEVDSQRGMLPGKHKRLKAGFQHVSAQDVDSQRGMPPGKLKGLKAGFQYVQAQ